MTQAADEDRQQRQQSRFHAREKEITEQVINALQQLRNQNRQITKKTVEKIIHVSNICSYYPSAKALIEDAIRAQRSANDMAAG